MKSQAGWGVSNFLLGIDDGREYVFYRPIRFSKP
jgi:hypothetical protein